VFRRVSQLSSQYITSEWIRSSQLSKREVEILQLLSLNRDNQAIAESLFLSVATVKNHIHHLLSKLGARSRVEAVAHWQMHRRSTGA
jgi:DNA-binding NarL/FixJ family response regulator